jgi:tetratricopeptide (TPR) repeat protein
MSNDESASLGWQRLHESRHGEARTLFEQVISRDAHHSVALHGAGFLAYLQGRSAEALDLLTRAVRADPARAEAYLHLSVVHHSAGRIEAAIDALRRAIAADPRHGVYHAGLGVLLQNRGDAAGAIDSYHRAIDLDPNDGYTLVNLAHLLLEDDRPEEAEPLARRAAESMPSLPLAHYKLGVALEQLGRGDEAITAIERSLSLSPENGDAHAALAMMLLRAGQLKRGWAEYEWRFAARNDPASMPALSTPRWNGSPIPRDATLLLQAEQGLGDTIQFSRFASMAKQRIVGGRVIVRCDERLVDLLHSLDQSIDVVSIDSPAPAHDVHAPLMSLPHLLGMESIHSLPSYLKADPARVAHWEERIRQYPRPRIGISWAGNPAHSGDRRRSIDPQLLAPLAQVADAAWFSLQRGARSLPPFKIVDWSAELDMNETAALMSALDLVISVDTAMAHLAGALGRPVWTLLAFVADWRWREEAGDTPWYSSMRLFRQPAPGDWGAVVSRVAQELSDFARAI